MCPRRDVKKLPNFLIAVFINMKFGMTKGSVPAVSKRILIHELVPRVK